MSDERDKPHDERRPTCGRFVPAGAGYAAPPPGGDPARDLPVGYCDADCAAIYPVECMSCHEHYRLSEVSGSTGLCDACFAVRP